MQVLAAMWASRGLELSSAGCLHVLPCSSVHTEPPPLSLAFVDMELSAIRQDGAGLAVWRPDRQQLCPRLLLRLLLLWWAGSRAGRYMPGLKGHIRQHGACMNGTELVAMR